MKMLQVKVKPNARASVLTPPAAEGEPWHAQLKAPPVEGRANEELVRLVAKHFACPRAAVRIKAGAGARLKLVQIDID
jgi:uncharacterized protein YggU (UPF0235/DUF167 family)